MNRPSDRLLQICENAAEKSELQGSAAKYRIVYGLEKIYGPLNVSVSLNIGFGVWDGGRDLFMDIFDGLGHLKKPFSHEMIMQARIFRIFPFWLETVTEARSVLKL